VQRTLLWCKQYKFLQCKCFLSILYHSCTY
jgi:hypothetical protein